MHHNSVNQCLKTIELNVTGRMKLIKPSETIADNEDCQCYLDKVLEIYRSAFNKLTETTITYSKILTEIKTAYENALSIRDKRIEHYYKQDKLFGVTGKKKQHDNKISTLLRENDELREQNMKLSLEIEHRKKEFEKLKDEEFSDYLSLMKERDARYTLYFENLSLHMKLKEFDGSSSAVDDAYGDPVVLRIALDRCREQLSTTQRSLNQLVSQYADTVPRRDHDRVASQHQEVARELEKLKMEHESLKEQLARVCELKSSMEEELLESKERCSELERAGTPRPHWGLCADFIGGGKDRWWQLANGLSSRETLRVLLKELGPAAESDHLEHFDGLGCDPIIPPYLRYEGKVRNLRLSRREISVVINDIWTAKGSHGQDMTMQDFVTKYFEDRYQQTTIRAEWAYNLCSGAEQMLDEPAVKLFWGALRGRLSERIYWAHRQQWRDLKEALYRQARDDATVTIEEFEKISKSTFPLKSEVDIKNLVDVMRKQLKMKVNTNVVNLDKLFQENEEGFDRIELARELYRQRQLAQDKFIREVVGVLGGRRAGNKLITAEALKRAFAIVDPAIDHIRMEQHLSWVFGPGRGAGEAGAGAGAGAGQPLRAVAARLAAGDIARAGLRARR